MLPFFVVQDGHLSALNDCPEDIVDLKCPPVQLVLISGLLNAHEVNPLDGESISDVIPDPFQGIVGMGILDLEPSCVEGGYLYGLVRHFPLINLSTTKTGVKLILKVCTALLREIR